MAVLCLNICGKAQTKISQNLSATTNSSISFGEGLSRSDIGSWDGALKPGDKVPASFWQIKLNTLNSKGVLEEVSMGNYKNKAILIDFWACWCGSCIVKLPLMDSLQAKFAGQLKILPVNGKVTKDTHFRIQELLSGKTYPKYKLSIPTVVDDVIITKLFPHNSVPHYVWINQSGVVKAITLSFLVNEENLKQMLEEEQ